MKRYQRSLREDRAKFRYRRSGNSHRNWRQRKAMREYQDSWNKRCRLLFCCLRRSDRHQHSFSDIARLLSEFFRDLDVVPSDVVAGLVLLRRMQRLEREAIVRQHKNETYQFLSGVPITPDTKFLDVSHPAVAEEVRLVIHYLHYALAVYGWPMFMIVHSATGCCQLCPYLRCCCMSERSRRPSKKDRSVVVDDNCCYCHYAALKKMCRLHNMEVVYATYHVEIGETPFFVALDHEKRTVVISIRGTLSLQDVITDLNAEGEQLPVDPIHEDWLGHKGMVQAAEYIRQKLSEESILTQAFYFSPDKGTHTYDLVLVGHSLGAGTAAILAILLKQEYPTLSCYAYSPPGGLLSMPAVEYTKSFITSVVLGKDVVPRIGLHQLEALRFDLIRAIKKSTDPKWKIIGGSMLCCCPQDPNLEVSDADLVSLDKRDVGLHPTDSSIALTVHQPLFPPGRIIHIVRNHPKKESKFIRSRKREPVYQALWAKNTDFDEVLISPVMIQDHMPDKVLKALEKLLVTMGPAKPQRILSEMERHQLLSPSADTLNSSFDRTPPHRLVLETSFTDLQPPFSPCNGERQQLDANQVQCNDRTTSSPLNHQQTVHATVPLAVSQNDSESKKVVRDLIHDDWLGLAPIASPETLSDISSVSSKGSHQRIASSSGNRFSWGGVSTMEPIAQSPATHRLIVQSPGSKMEVEGVTVHVSSDLEGLSNTRLKPMEMDTGDKQHWVENHQVMTEATVEEAAEILQMHALPDSQRKARTPECLHLNLQPLAESDAQSSGALPSEVDSAYTSASTERTAERMFTPRETKHVTFDLYSSGDSQEVTREGSEDSLYRYGGVGLTSEEWTTKAEPFVPTYPPFCVQQQQEYGTESYAHPPWYNYSTVSPLTSPLGNIVLFESNVSSRPSECVVSQEIDRGSLDAKDSNNSTRASDMLDSFYTSTPKRGIMNPRSTEPPIESSL